MENNRGTTEPGNVGDDVGPSFFYELEKLEPGRVLVQGVNNYKADICEPLQTRVPSVYGL